MKQEYATLSKEAFILVRLNGSKEKKAWGEDALSARAMKDRYRRQRRMVEAYGRFKKEIEKPPSITYGAGETFTIEPGTLKISFTR